MTFAAQGEQKGAVKSLEAKALLKNGITLDVTLKSGIEQGMNKQNKTK